MESPLPNRMTLSRDEIMGRVSNCVRKLLPRAKAKLAMTEASRLRWELGLDSMKLLELTFLLEQEFQWRGTEYDYSGNPIETLGDVVSFVSKLLVGGRGEEN